MPAKNKKFVQDTATILEGATLSQFMKQSLGSQHVMYNASSPSSKHTLHVQPAQIINNAFVVSAHKLTIPTILFARSLPGTRLPRSSQAASTSASRMCSMPRSSGVHSRTIQTAVLDRAGSAMHCTGYVCQTCRVRTPDCW